MKIAHNIFAGLFSSLCSALIGLIAIPYYLRYLGVEVYGLVGFFITIQALLQLLDVGLAPTMNREAARLSASGNMGQLKDLLHTLTHVYWLMGGLIFIGFFILAPLVADHWFKSKNIAQIEVIHAVMLMGVVFAFRWPVGLYQGVLIGSQRLAIASYVSVSATTISNLGAVLVLAYISPTIKAFFVWQAVAGLTYVISMRWAAWRELGGSKGSKFKIAELKRIWRYSAGMSAIAITGVIFTQLDKILLSTLLSLEEFGGYVLASTLVGGLYLVVSPVFNIIFPKFSSLLISGKTEKIVELYCLGTRTLTSILFPLSMILVFFGNDVIFFWTNNEKIALTISPVVALLAVGSALHGVMYFPYALQLAYGKQKIPLLINAALMLFYLPLVIYFVNNKGILGGGIAWLVLEVAYFFLGSWVTNRFVMDKIGWSWGYEEVAKPLLMSIVIIAAGKELIDWIAVSLYVRLLCELGLISFLSFILLFSSSKLRNLILPFIKKKLHYI